MQEVKRNAVLPRSGMNDYRPVTGGQGIFLSMGAGTTRGRTLFEIVDEHDVSVELVGLSVNDPAAIGRNG